MSEEWLRGETVRLRALEPEDLELLYRWENNPAWWDVGNTLAPYSRYLLLYYSFKIIFLLLLAINSL